MSKLAVTLALVASLSGCATPGSKLVYATSALVAVAAVSNAHANLFCGGSGFLDTGPCESNSTAGGLAIIAGATALIGVALDVNHALSAPAPAPALTVAPTPLYSSGPPGAPARRPEQVQLQLAPAR